MRLQSHKKKLKNVRGSEDTFELGSFALPKEGWAIVCPYCKILLPSHQLHHMYIPQGVWISTVDW